MRWTDVPAGKINAGNVRFWSAMGDDAHIVADRMATDARFVDEIVAFMKIDSLRAPISHKRARQIMGHNFFGIEEAIRHFKVKPTDDQLAELSEVPWSKALLQSVSNTHILVAVFPLSITDIRKQVGDNLFDVTYYHGEIKSKCKVWHDSMKCSWRLVRKMPVPDSVPKSRSEHKKMLSGYEAVPNTITLVYAMIGHFLESGDCLFGEDRVWTSDIDVRVTNPAHFYVCWSGNTANKLIVSSLYDNDNGKDFVGLATEVRPCVNVPL